jgi:hypothetical protein
MLIIAAPFSGNAISLSSSSSESSRRLPSERANPCEVDFEVVVLRRLRM